MNQKNLSIRLRSALAERRPTAVRELLHHHGLVAFASGLAAWSPRVVADALSLLPPAERAAVLRHLPSALREDSVVCGLTSVMKRFYIGRFGWQ